MKLIIGVTGATGAPIAIALLKELRKIGGIETHLIISKWARVTIEAESDSTYAEVEKLADVCYSSGNQAALISSGSFKTDGMIVVPCSMKTLAGIRIGFADGLIGRAADVILKEKRKLVLVPREMPLSAIHLENMLELSRLGAAIVPPMVAYYNHPQTIEDVTNHTVARVLDQFDLNSTAAKRWSGLTRHQDSE